MKYTLDASLSNATLRGNSIIMRNNGSKVIGVLRQEPLPVIYTALSFVRFSGSITICDVESDLGRIRLIQAIVLGAVCVSRMHYNLTLKAYFPADILNYNGKTGELIKYDILWWKPPDASLLGYKDGLPTEAKPLNVIHDISRNDLLKLALPESCIPLLKKEEEILYDRVTGKYGYKLLPNIKEKILREEAELFRNMEQRHS